MLLQCSDQQGMGVCIAFTLQTPPDFSSYSHTHCSQPHTIKKERELYKLGKREQCKGNGEK